MFDLGAVQAAVREAGLDGWLLYDFRGINVLAQRVADLAGKNYSRRWFYYVPATGEPKKLVHAIEPAALDHLPGTAKTVYRRWQDLETGVGELRYARFVSADDLAILSASLTDKPGG